MERAEAKSLGLNHYTTGRPCKRGHYAERSESTNGGCVECNRVRAAEWLTANRGASRARCKDWRAANPEKAMASNKAYRVANPERNKDWRAANPEWIKAYSRAYYRDPDKVTNPTTLMYAERYPPKEGA